eukprot:m.19615 g.19615  ORF g.19615 m.19615 type:complete len:317 (-) comp5974_c0_seq1:541-1491(-)
MQVVSCQRHQRPRPVAAPVNVGHQRSQLLRKLEFHINVRVRRPIKCQILQLWAVTQALEPLHARVRHHRDIKIVVAASCVDFLRRRNSKPKFDFTLLNHQVADVPHTKATQKINVTLPMASGHGLVSACSHTARHLARSQVLLGFNKAAVEHTFAHASFPRRPSPKDTSRHTPKVGVSFAALDLDLSGQRGGPTDVDAAVQNDGDGEAGACASKATVVKQRRQQLTVVDPVLGPVGLFRLEYNNVQWVVRTQISVGIGHRPDDIIPLKELEAGLVDAQLRVVAPLARVAIGEIGNEGIKIQMRTNGGGGTITRRHG